MKLSYLIPVSPIDSSNLPAKKFTLGDFFFKTLDEYAGGFPHSRISLLAAFWAAEVQADDSQSANHSAAHLPVSGQTAAEGVHGLDQILIFYSQLLLPDRKNRLASLKALTKNLHRLFLHFIGGHGLPPFFRQDGVFSGWLKT